MYNSFLSFIIALMLTINSAGARNCYWFGFLSQFPTPNPTTSQIAISYPGHTGLFVQHYACLPKHHSYTTASLRFVPVSCFIYRSEKAKPCNKWSTFVKIELKETLLDLRERFAINDYGGFKNKAAEKGAGKPDFQLGVKHKKPDPPEFPNSRLFKP